jgi:glutamine cyclotransferase
VSAAKARAERPRPPGARCAAPAILTLLGAVAAAPGCGARADQRAYTVVAQFPHDTSAYTQGLVYSGEWLFESTGRYGRSDLRRVQLETGRVDAVRRLPEDRFGEGLALLGGRLYQLTWKSGAGYIYDPATLALADSFSYAGEGWGLTTDGSVLIMSDGTATLRFYRPEGFELIRSVTVRDKGSALSQLNELEYVRGELFANVYQSDWIVRIDPESGEVLEWLDFKGLLPESRRTASTDVLNGIAFIEARGTFLVTGKLWPLVFEVRLAR